MNNMVIELDYYIFNSFIMDGYLHGDNNLSSNFERYKIKLPNGIWKTHPDIKHFNNNGIRGSEVTLKMDVIKNREHRLNKILE